MWQSSPASELVQQGLSGNAIRTGEVSPGQALPLLIEPGFSGVDLLTWAESSRKYVEKELARRGGLLFRGFNLESAEAFQQFMKAACGEPLEYTERSSPRSQVSGRIYTSTDYPPDQEIFLHNEQSYNRVFPRKIAFFCIQPAEQGGATPICDSRRVLERLDPELRCPFEEDGYLYQRNFAHGFGLDWQSAFQTDDPFEVEDYCDDNEIEFEWLDDGNHLRTRQVRRAVAVHPRTGERSWFNHLTFFHVSTLPAGIRKSLLAEFKEEDLPNNTYYADGSPIEAEVLEELRRVYRQETVGFAWQKGDVMVLENTLVAHSRTDFKGPRQVVVAMADPASWDDVPA